MRYKGEVLDGLTEKEPVGPSGVAQEIKIWADSLKWASEQTNQGNYENAIKSLESVKKMSGRLITMVKKLQKDLGRPNIHSGK
jgi:hypothetical protein